MPRWPEQGEPIGHTTLDDGISQYQRRPGSEHRDIAGLVRDRDVGGIEVGCIGCARGLRALYIVQRMGGFEI